MSAIERIREQTSKISDEHRIGITGPPCDLCQIGGPPCFTLRLAEDRLKLAEALDSMPCRCVRPEYGHIYDCAAAEAEKALSEVAGGGK